MFNRNNNRIIDSILDDCLERILANGESIEECLARYRQYADELKPLLQTAITARKAAMAIKPGADFKARARYQFHAALREASTKKRGRFFNWQLKWVTATSLALTLMLSGGGVVAAASNSMPDSPLYQVKLATEQVQLFFTSSPEGEAELHAKLVDRRVDEIVSMAGEDNATLVEATTVRLQDHLAAIVAISAGGSDSVLLAESGFNDLVAMTVTETVTLTAGAGGVGDMDTLGVTVTVDATVPTAVATVTKSAGETETSGDTTATVTPVTVSEIDDLADQMRQQSTDNIAALNAALESASEEVKAALIQAITILENVVTGESAPGSTTTVTETVTETIQ